LFHTSIAHKGLTNNLTQGLTERVTFTNQLQQVITYKTITRQKLLCYSSVGDGMLIKF